MFLVGPKAIRLWQLRRLGGEAPPANCAAVLRRYSAERRRFGIRPFRPAARRAKRPLAGLRGRPARRWLCRTHTEAILLDRQRGGGERAHRRPRSRSRCAFARASVRVHARMLARAVVDVSDPSFPSAPMGSDWSLQGTQCTASPTAPRHRCAATPPRANSAAVSFPASGWICRGSLQSDQPQPTALASRPSDRSDR